MNVDKVTLEVLDRFGKRLGMALFYRHNHRRLVGTVESWIVNKVTIDQAFIDEIVGVTPMVQWTAHNGADLTDQFGYRFDHSAESGFFWAFVVFGGQFAIKVLAIDHSLAKQLEEFDDQAA